LIELYIYRSRHLRSRREDRWQDLGETVDTQRHRNRSFGEVRVNRRPRRAAATKNRDVKFIALNIYRRASYKHLTGFIRAEITGAAPILSLVALID
jgi:hypothetical protein